MPRGGSRPGAGRPKGSKDPHTLAKQIARTQLEGLIHANIVEMTEPQISASKGIQHFVLRGKDGKFEKVTSAEAAIAAMNDPECVYEFWTRDPSIQAFSYLIDQAIDKAAQPQKLTGADDGPVEMVIRWKK